MRVCFLLVIVCMMSVQVFGQGSGKSLNFDGVDDYVSVGTSATLRPTTAITVEAWIKPSSIGNWVAMVGNLFDTGSSEAGYGIISNSSTGNIIFWVQTIGGSSDSYGNYPSYTPTIGVWQHIVGTYDGANMKIYANGVLIATKAKTGNIKYASPTPLDMRIGQYYDDDESTEYTGEIDEVRVWNTARTITQIKDNMCKKLIGTETGLLGYWRFDDGTGTTLTDVKAANNGTLNNMSAAAWVTSAAAIGDASTYLYTGSWASQTIILSSTSNGDFEVNTVSGTPSGIQVYRVDQAPNTTSGTSGATGNNSVYYGTFIIGGTSPTYTVKYDYTNYPDAIKNEASLVLYNRASSAATTWANMTATLNTTANTLTKTSVNARGEFILGNTVVPLPIEILYFNTELKNENTVQINWGIASGNNIKSFIIERSSDQSDWKEIAEVPYEYANSFVQYDYQPLKAISYYRLKQIGKDGSIDYSALKVINNSDNTTIHIFPIPANEYIYVSAASGHIVSIELYNSKGIKIACEQSFIDENIQLNISNITTGIYFLKIFSIDNKFTNKEVVIL